MESLELELIKKNIKQPLEKMEPDADEDKEMITDEERIVLKKELKKFRNGGVDYHLSRINVHELIDDELVLYKKYKERRLLEEDISEFNKKNPAVSLDYNFGAMLRQWIIDRSKKDKAELKEKMREAARKKIEDMTKTSPAVDSYLKEIFDKLKQSDYEVVLNLNEENFKTYEQRLKDYFKLVAKGADAPKTQEEILAKIEMDPRYQHYRVLREIQKLNPVNPDYFINN